MYVPCICSLCWLVPVGKTVNHVLLLAQLRVNGKSHGMQPFVVQIRSLQDHTPLPGKGDSGYTGTVLCMEHCLWGKGPWGLVSVPFTCSEKFPVCTIHTTFSCVQISSPPLIRPPYLPRNCGHIREVALVRGRSKCIHSSSAKSMRPH